MPVQIDLQTVAFIVLFVAVRAGWDIFNTRKEIEGMAKEIKRLTRLLEGHSNSSVASMRSIENAAWKIEAALSKAKAGPSN